MGRLTGLWWWIDRWRKSTAYTDMTLEQQGAYRNLLDECHLRGGAIPNDDRILAKSCGDATAWSRVCTVVLARFELRPDGWHNITMDEVMAKSVELSEKRSLAGKAGNERRWGNGPIANGIANGIAKPSQTGTSSPTTIANGIAKGIAPSPSPSPDPYLGPSPSPSSRSNNKLVSSGSPHTTSTQPANGHALRKVNGDARSKRPIFTGQRLTVFEWMFDDCAQTLGPLTEAFDLHDWFFALDKRLTTQNFVIPKRDNGQWLQAELLQEARNRGLPIAVVAAGPSATTVSNAINAQRAMQRIMGGK